MMRLNAGDNSSRNETEKDVTFIQFDKPVVSVENIDLCFGLAGLKLPDWAHFGAPNMAEALRRSRETLVPLGPDWGD